jgi:hypothetical protein
MSLGLAKLAGNSRLRVMLDEGATVGDLLDHLCGFLPFDIRKDFVVL